MRPLSKCAPDWEEIYAAAERTPACCWRCPTPRRKEQLDMAKVDWPAADKRTHIGKRISRIDAPLKTTGAAKYSYDINRPGMLWAKVVTCPYAKADFEDIDTSAAEKLPGVKAVWKETETKSATYVGQIVAAVAAETEEIATEAARLVKVKYTPQEHQVVDSDPSLMAPNKAFPAANDKPSTKKVGDVAQAFADGDSVVTSGVY